MSEIVKIEIQADVDTAASNIAKVNDELRITNEESDKTTESVSDMSDQIDDMTGGAISKFKSFKESVLKVAKGFFTLKGAIIASGVGALALIIGSIAAAFTQSEEGQNKYAKLMGQIGVVTGNFLDILSDLGEKLLEPQKLFKDIADTLKNFVIKQFQELSTGVGLLASAFSKFFDGNFKEAAGDLAKGFTTINGAVNPIVVGTKLLTKGIQNTIKATKELIAENIKEIELAGRIADARAAADIAERALIVDRATADKTRAELLEKAIDREKFTTSERIAFLEEAGELEDKITQQEMEAAELRLNAMKMENLLTKSTKEEKDAQAVLEAELINLETAKLNKQREVTSQVIALRAEEAAAFKAIRDQQLAEEKTIMDEIDAIAAANFAKATGYITKEAALKKVAEEAARQQANQTFANLSMLAGQGSTLGKAMAVADATMSGISGVQNAYTTALSSPITAVFPPYPFIQAGIAAAFSAKQIQSIVSVKTPMPSSSAGAGRSLAAAIPSAPPSFNVVGQAPENQLASAIAGDENKPLKAFVVSSEVSNQVALDRSIEETATLG